jgi:hypothetical protein
VSKPPKKKLAALFRESKRFPIASHGDPIEIEHAELTAAHLPGYERLWQMIAFPFREHPHVWLKRGLHPAHEAAVIYHYSIFRAALRINEVLERAVVVHHGTGAVGSDLFYDACIWIGVGYDRAAQQAGALAQWLIHPQDENRIAITGWDSKARELDEFLDSDIRERVQRANNLHVKPYRNHIVHGPPFPGSRDRIPTPYRMDDLVSWSQWTELAQRDPEAWTEATDERLTVLIDLFAEWCVLVDEFWATIHDRLRGQQDTLALPDLNLASMPDDVRASTGPATLAGVASPSD